jgi:BirA family biotin operon repressor/biotin-[acetyl-CoA-carboxylase] ligase
LLGLALIQSLESHFSGDFSLKAPNDVYLGGRKLAGILIEMIQTGPRTKIIIGLGLNVLALRHDHPERAALVNLTEVDEDFAKQWSGFLDQLYQAWTELSTQPPTMIAANECQALLVRLRKNQHHQGLSAVSTNGSLQTTEGQWIHWENL